MSTVADKVFDIALQLYACSDADLHDANQIRMLVGNLEIELREARAEIKRLKQGLVADMADALTKMPTTNGVIKPDPIMTELAKAYAEIERLKAENEKLKAYAPDPFDDSLPTYAQLVKDLHETESELSSVRDMLLDVAHSGVEIDLKKYVTVQINRIMWYKIQKWAKNKEPT